MTGTAYGKRLDAVQTGDTLQVDGYTWTVGSVSTWRGMTAVSLGFRKGFPDFWALHAPVSTVLRTTNVEAFLDDDVMARLKRAANIAGVHPATHATVDPETDSIACLCGNHPNADGFYPCLATGQYVEPLRDGPWGDLYRCDRCDRVIRYPDGLVVGTTDEAYLGQSYLDAQEEAR